MDEQIQRRAPDLPRTSAWDDSAQAWIVTMGEDGDVGRKFVLDAPMIGIQNWHRPLGTSMEAFLRHGLVLKHFSEPAPTGGEPNKVEIMEWQKPAN